LEKVGLSASGDSSSSGGAAAITVDGSTSVLDTPGAIVKPYIFQNNKGLLEDAYKRGFDDATNDKEFGMSLEELLQKQQEDKMNAAPSMAAYHHHHDDFHDLPPPRVQMRESSSSMMSASSIFSILYIGRTFYSAGQTVHGGFDVQLMIANLRTMDKIRLAMLGFSIYRLVIPFLS
jgi:hypothetical protein